MLQRRYIVASTKSNLNYKKIPRGDFKYRKVEERIKDYKTIYIRKTTAELSEGHPFAPQI